jgi:hypothetical protein
MRTSLQLASFFFALGCSAPDALPDAQATSDAVLVDSPAAQCSEATWVRRVEGRALDELGAPIGDGRAQLCVHVAPDDRLVCLVPPRTNADGTFTIEVDESIHCLTSATLRLLVPSGGFATTYCPVDVTRAGAGALSLEVPIVVTHVPPSSALPPRGDAAQSREVDLGVATLQLAPSALPNEQDYARLGARAVMPSTSCVPAMRAMDGLVLFAPESELTQPVALSLRIPSASAGERYALHLLGGIGTTLADDTPVAEGELALLGIETADATGRVTLTAPLRYLSQVGFRRVP